MQQTVTHVDQLCPEAQEVVYRIMADVIRRRIASGEFDVDVKMDRPDGEEPGAK